MSLEKILRKVKDFALAADMHIHDNFKLYAAAVALTLCTGYCYRNEISDVFHPERPSIEITRETNGSSRVCDISANIHSSQGRKIKKVSLYYKGELYKEWEVNCSKADLLFSTRNDIRSLPIHKYSIIVEDYGGNSSERFYREFHGKIDFKSVKLNEDEK